MGARTSTNYRDRLYDAVLFPHRVMNDPTGGYVIEKNGPVETAQLF